jgi:ribonuclease D
MGSYSIQADLTAEDLARLRKSEAVGIDTEMTGLNPHRDLLCLVQVSDHDGNVVFVKRRDWERAAGLRELLEDEGVMKVFHFALMDCSFLMKHTGAIPRNVFCTKIASKLARTYSPEHGLSRLLQELLEVKLDKTQQTSNWLAEKLSQDQLRYAANDVIWLNELRARLEKLLETKGSLPSGITYRELNERCRAFVPTLCHLFLGGWEVGGENRHAVFAH